jgi:hypothetical protein
MQPNQRSRGHKKEPPKGLALIRSHPKKGALPCNQLQPAEDRQAMPKILAMMPASTNAAARRAMRRNVFAAGMPYAARTGLRAR